MSRKLILIIMSVLLIAGLMLAACQEQPQVTPETQVIEKEVVVKETVQVEVEVEVEKLITPEAPRIERTGAWLDSVVVVEEPSANAAVSRLEVGDISLYAFAVSNPDVAAQVAASAALDSERSFGSYSELTLNPAGPVLDNGLNPFAVPAIREALNWLLDREYIAQELHGGMAVPRWLPFNNASSDYALLADVARGLEAKYAYNPELASEVITEEMGKLGAELVGGTWQYEGSPVNLTVLIRTEDERRAIGDYVSNQLEDLGFTVTRDYKTGAEASPIWIGSDPADGLFHVYTGGWVTTVVPRDLGDNFSFFYTDRGLAFPLWQAYTPTAAFDALSERLENRDYKTMAERRDMMAEALGMALEDSVRVWLVDRASISPRRAEVAVASDLYGAVSGSRLWPYTLRRVGEVGGSMTFAMPSILPEPWNPLGGSNWIYDQMLIRGTGEFAFNTDPYTGLALPNRVERAEVFIEEGLPVGVTHDWVTLEFVPEIEVPEDAWINWDAEEQRFITVGEQHPEGLTSLSKRVLYYPADLYSTVKWHDGSAFSAADMVMRMILTFDRAKEASAVYDPAVVSAYDAFVSAFRGTRIVSTNPLVIEYYSDSYELDAEQNAQLGGLDGWWPMYAYGQGSWHTLALGLQAEANGETAFSSAKAEANEVEWLSYIAGPTIDILKSNLDVAVEEGLIPYEATLSQFITADEAASRWSNLQEWVRTRNHFWVGTGPFYLERAFPVEGTVILQRNRDYPDSAYKWDRFAAPAIAEVEIDGPARVSIGSEATFDVFVDFQDEPYAIADIKEVKYLVFDAAGDLAHVGEAEAVEDGLWEVVLGSDVTSALTAGSNRLEVVVVSYRVALPSFTSVQFVTAP